MDLNCLAILNDSSFRYFTEKIESVVTQRPYSITCFSFCKQPLSILGTFFCGKCTCFSQNGKSKDFLNPFVYHLLRVPFGRFVHRLDVYNIDTPRWQLGKKPGGAERRRGALVRGRAPDERAVPLFPCVSCRKNVLTDQFILMIFVVSPPPGTAFFQISSIIKLVKHPVD